LVPTPTVRLATPDDLVAVAAIQSASREASQWNPSDYLDHDFRVAIVGNTITGFVVFRRITEDEREILNLAVAPEFRRKGIGNILISTCFEGFRGDVFLEVRASNTTAIKFYKSLNFKILNIRHNYYDSPPEAAIVMKFHSC
jgi:ribosomal-protein-alanine N-acetyltransferase